ncbi:MAG: N-acetyltransferase [Acidimicrobiales bacterium]|jgi:ribosomal protein S18 acetylase RimI-like enzyme
MLPIPEFEIRRAGVADVAKLVEVLARAFDDDPMPSFLFRGEKRRRRGLRRFFFVQLRHMYLSDGEVWTTTDTAGAALWAPPNKPRSGLRDLVHFVPLLADLAGLGRRAGDAMHLLQLVDLARPREAHWYLATLGTDPDRQGQGVGSALLRKVLERADLEGLPAYLESSKERNLAFYGRHGFEVTGEIHTPGGGPTLWLMWRECRPASR